MGVIKYSSRRCKSCSGQESDLTTAHRCDSHGLVATTVFLDASQELPTGGELVLNTKSVEDARTKVHLGFHNYSDGSLTKESSMNDLLKAIYDVLEGGRIIYSRQRATQRRMGMDNVAMYPGLVNLAADRIHSSERTLSPHYIRDVLEELNQPPDAHVPASLMIDVDNVAMSDASTMGVNVDCVPYRTGTPMYVARSVCLGKSLDYALSLMGVPMPTLTGQAKRLYVQAHGQERYDRFTEKSPLTCHGAIPPRRQPNPLPAVLHHPRHDAESIFWLMFATILRVQPKDGAREEWATSKVARVWQKLLDHEIPAEPDDYMDERESIFTTGQTHWDSYFHPEMLEVAQLLFAISAQIAPEYELWTPAPPEDHLHEALQRIILQYLVEHRDRDIALDPDHLRPTQPRKPHQRCNADAFILDLR